MLKRGETYLRLDDACEAPEDGRDDNDKDDKDKDNERPDNGGDVRQVARLSV